MAEFFLRLIICLGVITAGFVVLSARSASGDGRLWLLFPLLGAVPASLAAALLFVPIESFARAHGLEAWATPAVILAGASIVFLFGSFALFRRRPGRTRATRTPVRFGQFVKAASIWIVLGALWGGLWRASDVLLAWFGTPS